jgi:hypothetical protein
MSEHALQQVGRLADKLDRIADAALRASRTDTAVRELQILKRDLALIKAALRPPPATEPKPGQGKHPAILGGAALTAGELAFLAALAALAVATCLMIQMIINRTSIEESTANLWTAITEGVASAAVTLVAVRSLVVTEVERIVPVGHRCRPDYDCALAAMTSIAQINSLDIPGAFGALSPSGRHFPPPRWHEAGQAFIQMLEVCLGSLIRCIDPDDTAGWWTRLVGPDGVVTRTITRWRDWRPQARIPRPGGS